MVTTGTSINISRVGRRNGSSYGLLLIGIFFFLTVPTFCSASNQHRIGSLFKDANSHQSVLDNSNGPEDLLLEELVRHWKWAKVQQKLQQNEDRALDVTDDEDEEQAMARPIFRHTESKTIAENRQQQVEPSVRQHPFAYRPNEPGFSNDDAAIQEQREQLSNPMRIEPGTVLQPESSAVVRDVKSMGQKENIFEEFPAAPGPAIVADKTSQKEQVHEDLYQRDGPVAHAMVHPEYERGHTRNHDSIADIYLTALVAGCTASAVAAILALGVCFYRWQRRAKSAQDVEYPAYGITGPGPSPSGKSSLKSSPSSSTAPSGLVSGWGTKSPKLAAASGDKKLAHSAHMFHFQHQKQQVIAMESHSGCERRGSNSGGESDEDNEEGDYTVYECPGLAPTGEMEVRNPLFEDNPTPASPALTKRQAE
nr:EOG090X0B4J [Chydorus sphaericus]